MSKENKSKPREKMNMLFSFSFIFPPKKSFIKV